MKIKVIIFLLLQSLLFSALAGDYPKSNLERDIDEMGSIVGGEGITFKPKIVKSTSTQASTTTNGKVNKYLYQAALEVLKFAPIASADSTNGVIITDWYSPPDSPDTQFKINVFIKDDVINFSALEVNAFERVKKGKNRSDDVKPSSISNVLKDKILRKARDLYILNNKK